MITNGGLLLASIITTGVVAAFAPLGATVLGAKTRAEERRRLRHADLLRVYERMGESLSTAIKAFANFDNDALKDDPRLTEGRHIFRLLRLHAASAEAISAAEGLINFIVKGPGGDENWLQDFVVQADLLLTDYYTKAGQHLLKVLGAKE